MVIFLDGCDAIFENIDNPLVEGFTTNPALMLKAGVKDYEEFAKEVLLKTRKPVAFEVLSDDFDEMYKQAKHISKWGLNVNVKIPITNSKGDSSLGLIAQLVSEGVNINITAITKGSQVTKILPVIFSGHGFLSVFAGRIADTGVNPVPTVREIVQMKPKGFKVIWASTREVYNVRQAELAGADVITLSADLLKKLPYIGRDVLDMSKEVVTKFIADGKSFCLRVV